MVLSSIQVLLEIKSEGSVIKRCLSTALVPRGEQPATIDAISGEVVIAKSERKTRANVHPFSTDSEVKGKICVCESFDKASANSATMFACKVGAQSLVVAHTPSYTVTIPTIVITNEEFQYIKDHPSAIISAVYISGSYKTINNVTLKAQNMSTDSSPLEWQSKMFVPSSMLKKTTSGLDFRYMIQPTPYRGGRSNILDSFFPRKDISGKICVFNCEYPEDANRAVELATEYGASAMLICCKETPNWSSLTLPVVTIDRIQFEDLKKAGLRSGDLGVTISYEKDALEPGRKVDPPSSAPSKRSQEVHWDAHQTKRDPPESKGFLGKLLNNTKKAIFGYSPKSKDEFAIIRKEGFSWSHDRPNYASFSSAMRTLDRIRKIEVADEQEAEVKSLVEAIREMTEEKCGGDVLVILFCAHTFQLKEDLNINASTFDLTNAMVAMVNRITIDPEVAPEPLKDDYANRNVLDSCMVRLTRNISNRPSNISKHTTFVLNALWIRSYYCKALEDGSWVDLKSITSLKYIENHRDTIIEFMEPITFNTLIITSIAHDIMDVCRIFDGENEVRILPKALKILQEIYERDKRTRQMWANKVGETGEIAMLNLIERLVVRNEAKSAKNAIISSVIKRASFEYVNPNTFQHLDRIYSSITVDYKCHDMIVTQIEDSICSSLKRRGRFSPTPSDVSNNVLQANVGWLLVNKAGWAALMSFTKENYFKKGGFELFGHIYDLFIREHEWSEYHVMDDLVEAICYCIPSSSSRSTDFAATVFEVANSWRDIFTDPEDQSKSICPHVGKLIVSKTGLASTIRRDPSTMHDIRSFQIGSSNGMSLIDCLSRELIQDLAFQCSKIEDAVSFCTRAKSSQLSSLEILASDIILSSFAKWSPSNMDELLQVNAATLVHAHTLLSSIPEGDTSDDENRHDKGKYYAHKLKSIIMNWLSNYRGDDCNEIQLVKVSSVLTEEKRKALVEISDEASFPTRSELGEKILAIKNMLGEIRSTLTIQSENDGVSCSHSILDLATSYRINIDRGSLIYDLISKYFCGTEPIISLGSLHGDRDTARLFLDQHGCELQAAAYFLTNKSVLFQNEVGTWLDISIGEFLAKISTILRHFATLFSTNATFSVISEAAKVLTRENVCVETELRTIGFFSHLGVDIVSSIPRLLDNMTIAMLSEPLQKFVDCCKTYKFMIAASDEKFSALVSICERLFGEDGLVLVGGECYEMGLGIADILTPNTPPEDLCHRLRKCLPTLQFFGALRHCSTVFSLAKERLWFGEEGLRTFYKEYTNISNVFSSNKSFENEVLDRLEPTIRAISAVGGELGCCSIASLMETLKDNLDILKLDEMRLVQANICKVQEWFSEGMDDMAAILSKFSLIQRSGSFMLYSQTMEESAVPKRSLALRYSRSETSNDTTTMSEDDMKEFVQYLRFVNHNSDESTNSAAKFIDAFSQFCQIMQNQQAMIDVGFEDEFSTSPIIYALHESAAAITEYLEDSRHKLDRCNLWLQEVRSKYRYSLLFWMDELRYIFQCMCQLRIIHHDTNAVMRESEPLQKILEALSRLSPDVSQHSKCLDLILQCINDSPSSDSWIEDVSNLVDMCGIFSATLQLPCFKPVERACHKKIMIHKINCCEDMLFATPLHLLQHIYKSRRPAPFEVLDGACTQSPNEIQLFLDRVLAFPDQTFTIISVDELRANEQEIIANFLAKHSRSADKMHLHCIQSKDTIIYAPPGVEIHTWDGSSLNKEQYGSWLQNHVIRDSHVNSVTVVCGGPASGKTHHIRGEMEKLSTIKGSESASMYIHEDFCLAKAVALLKSKFKCKTSRNRAIHFGFSIAASEIPSKDLMLSINSFFNMFLVLHSVYDPSSGSCFHSGMHSYDLFIELNCADSENACRAWLGHFVPILTCCNNNIIQPPSAYIIDDQARRVCTYLRAFDDGTIDRKFNSIPRNKRIMFVLDKSGSMSTNLGGRNALEVATDSMLNIFDSHLQLMDHVGLIRFNNQFEELIPLQRVESNDQRSRLRTTMHGARNNPCGTTSMFTALTQAVNSLVRNDDGDGDAWIICLTDGLSMDSKDCLTRQLQNSPDNLHVVLVGVNLPEQIDGAMEELCNKYQDGNAHNKGFFLPTSANMAAIEDAFSQVASRIPVSQTFELDGIMSIEECRAKLEEHRPEFIDPQNKLLYSFWVSFLFRRVSVFDQNSDFNYNEEHDSLGSSLMEVMLSESRQMLSRKQNCSWTSSNHTQLIYDFSQKNSPKFRLICTAPDNLESQKREMFQTLNLPGFNIPTTSELRKRETLDQYLSQVYSSV